MAIQFRSALLFFLLVVGCGPGKRDAPVESETAVADGGAAPGEVTTPAPPKPKPPPGTPRQTAGRYFDRVFIIVMENESAPVIHSNAYYQNLASRGASFGDAHGVARPSYSNYLAILLAWPTACSARLRGRRLPICCGRKG